MNMFDKFGEMNSATELNELADNLLQIMLHYPPSGIGINYDMDFHLLPPGNYYIICRRISQHFFRNS